MFLTWQLPILQIWHWVWSLNWAKDDGQGEMGGTPWEPSKGLDSSPSVTQWSMGPRLSHFMSTSISLGTEGGHCEQMFCFAAILFCVLWSLIPQWHHAQFPLTDSSTHLPPCILFHRTIKMKWLPHWSIRSSHKLKSPSFTVLLSSYHILLLGDCRMYTVSCFAC